MSPSSLGASLLGSNENYSHKTCGLCEIPTGSIVIPAVRHGRMWRLKPALSGTFLTEHLEAAAVESTVTKVNSCRSWRRHSVWGFEPTLKLWPFWLIFVIVWISAVLLTEILQIPKELHTSRGVASEVDSISLGGLFMSCFILWYIRWFTRRQLIREVSKILREVNTTLPRYKWIFCTSTSYISWAGISECSLHLTLRPFDLDSESESESQIENALPERVTSAELPLSV